MNEEEISLELCNIIPKDQLNRVFSARWCDIEPSFLGFMKQYKYLSEIIPKHFTIVDLGCAYNAQSFYFIDYKRFIGVDNFPDTERFMAPGTEFYEISIKDFIDEYLHQLDLAETFAICSYVPPWGADNIKLVRENFLNVFTFYPSNKHRNIFEGLSDDK